MIEEISHATTYYSVNATQQIRRIFAAAFNSCYVRRGGTVVYTALVNHGGVIVRYCNMVAERGKRSLLHLSMSVKVMEDGDVLL